MSKLMKEVKSGILTKWWVWVIAIFILLLAFQEYRVRSIQEKWQAVVEKEVRARLEKAEAEQKVFREKYQSDLKALSGEVEKIKKAKVIVDTRIKESERKIDDIRKKTYSRDVIDRKLDELIPRPGVGAP